MSDLFNSTEANVPMKRQPGALQNSAIGPWNKQLSLLLRQSWDILNAYKDPDALENIVPGFAHVLDGMEMRDIENAFKSWMKDKESFPTPAAIRKLAEGFRTIRLQNLGASIPKSWTQVIRDRDTDEILAEYPHPRESLSNIAAEQKHGKNIRIAMRQD